MKTKLLAALAALALLATVPRAEADILKVTFEGTYVSHTAGAFAIGLGGVPFQFQIVPYSALNGDPYVATLFFDTDGGALSFSPDGAVVLQGGEGHAALSMSITISDSVLGNITSSGIGCAGSDCHAFLSWQFDSLGNPQNIKALAQNGFGSLDFRGPPHSFGSDGFFQSGPCPGTPCGHVDVTSSTLTDLSGLLSAVPGPVVGAGLPGVLLLGGLLAWRRRKFAQG